MREQPQTLTVGKIENGWVLKGDILVLHYCRAVTRRCCGVGIVNRRQIANSKSYGNLEEILRVWGPFLTMILKINIPKKVGIIIPLLFARVGLKK